MNQQEIETQIQQLDRILSEHPDNEEQLLIERGNLYWKMQDWSLCMADFDQAIALNSQSMAVELKRSVSRIISYYYKDVYNP